MDLIHSLNHVDWFVLSPIHTHSLQRHVSQLKEATICAMAHMLTANIDSGLTHAIGRLTLYCAVHEPPGHAGVPMFCFHCRKLL